MSAPTIASATETYSLTIEGEVPSKSNQYRIVTINGRGSLAKSGKAKAFDKLAQLQIPAWAKALGIESPMRVELDVYMSSRRPDLDNAAKSILDNLQKAGVMKNDNKVIELVMRKLLDKDRPRTDIRITPLL